MSSGHSPNKPSYQAQLGYAHLMPLPWKSGRKMRWSSLIDRIPHWPLTIAQEGRRRSAPTAICDRTTFVASLTWPLCIRNQGRKPKLFWSLCARSGFIQRLFRGRTLDWESVRELQRPREGAAAVRQRGFDLCGRILSIIGARQAGELGRNQVALSLTLIEIRPI